MTQAAQLAAYGSQGTSLGFKNRIINGDMRIDQRNAGAAVTGSGAFPVDRWIVDQSVAAKLSSQRSTTAPAGFTNSLAITTANAYSVGTSDYYILNQRIEGYNVADLGWGTSAAKPVTVSFWVRSSLTGMFGGSLRNQSAQRSYPFSYNINAANTWEYKTITVPGDTSGTWITDSGIGMFVYFGLGVGPTFTGTAGAWVGTNNVSVTGAVSVVGTAGATFYITGVQLEVGTSATPFEYRDYGRELIMCQRYYEYQFYYFRNSSAGYQYRTVPWKVSKRASPTVTYSVSELVNMTNYGASAAADGYNNFVVNPYANSSDNYIGETIYGNAEL